MDIRLDIFLVKWKGVPSREKAKQLITGGKVFVDGFIAKKVSQKINKSSDVTVEDTHIYVSRSAHKLLAAIKIWSIKVADKICLDIGSSTGGFTEVLLREGAQKIYAVDVGVNQLHKSIKSNHRVISIEGKDIRDIDSSHIKDPINLVVIDVSFISLTHIIPLLNEFGDSGMEVIALLKPQFEVGKKYLKKGIVKNDKKVEEVKKSVSELFVNEGFEIQSPQKSPIKGKEGNQEYLLYAVKK